MNPRKKKTTLAFIGCGFVADFYIETIAFYPQLEVKGCYDKIKEKTDHFAKFHQLHAYKSLDEIAADSDIDIVVNLTNPSSHFEVSKFFLEKGKHIYSEKPLADSFEKSKILVALAKEKNLALVGSPCTLYSNTARTIKKALDEHKIGEPRLVYAEIDDGPVDIMTCEKWLSKSGTPWPIEDEFRVGCTQEHAGYYVSWLLHFFGPAERVVAFSKCLKPQKREFEIKAPDFSAGILYFKSGMVARLTHGIYAPHNQSFTIIGDKGSVGTDNSFHHSAPVYYENFNSLNLKTHGHPFSKIPGMKRILNLIGAGKKRISLIDRVPFKHRLKKNMIDFGIGLDKMADDLYEDQASLLSGDFLLHINEIVFALSNANIEGQIVELETTF